MPETSRDPDSKGIAWQEWAWNGIGFQAPAGWQVAAMGRRYLLLEDETGPVMEVKWGPIRGKFSVQTHFRRLTAVSGGKAAKTIEKIPLPASWAESLRSYEATGFTWRGPDISGLGILLFCKICRQVTLIQFYRQDVAQPLTVSTRILSTFRDHSRGNHTDYIIYDIRASIPKPWTLDGYRFEAGRFELRFTSDGRKIILLRYGPASILLADTGLAGWGARTHQPLAEAAPSAIQSFGRDALEWRVFPPSSRWRRVWRRLRNQPLFQCLRLWRLVEANRILGVRAEGKRPVTKECLDDICRRYESV